MFSKATKKYILLALVIFSITSTQAQAQNNWASVKAELTLEEYLNIFFLSKIKQHTIEEKVETHFIANSSPKDAILYIVLPIVVPVSDLPTRANLAQSLKKKIALYTSHVDKLFRSPAISKRWKNANTKDNLIIHLVDSHDSSKTVGVYLEGNSTFDEQKNREKLSLIRKKVGNCLAK